MKRTVVLMLGLCVGAAACFADELYKDAQARGLATN